MNMTIEESFFKAIHKVVEDNNAEIRRLEGDYKMQAFDAIQEYEEISNRYPDQYVGLKNLKLGMKEFDSFLEIYTHLSYFPDDYWFEEEYYLLHPEDSLKDIFLSFEDTYMSLMSCWKKYLEDDAKVLLPLNAFLGYESQYRFFSVVKLFSNEQLYSDNGWNTAKEIKRRKRLKSDDENFKEVLISFNEKYFRGEFTMINWKPKDNSTGAHVLHKLIEDSYQIILRPMAISIYKINEPFIEGGLISKNEVYRFIFDCFQAICHKKETVFQEYDPDIYKQSDYTDENDYKQRRVNVTTST